MTKTVLTIAGTDPTGGAGIYADIKTISSLGGYALGAITAVLAQNSQRVGAVEYSTPTFLEQQIEHIVEEMPVHAVKIGMIGNDALIKKVCECLSFFSTIPVVYDPVMIASSGGNLRERTFTHEILWTLLRKVTLLTPNLSEAAFLLKCHLASNVEDMKEQARQLHQKGVAWVLLKGGHLEGSQHCADVLIGPGYEECFYHERVITVHGRGTGCTLSSALAYFMIDHDIPEAVQKARAYVLKALQLADQLQLTQQKGPLWHGL